MPLSKTLFRLTVGTSLLLLGGCKMVVMSPSGDIARQQADLIIVATALMLLIIVPVLFLTLYFAWHYRHSNKKAKYDPEWHHSTRLEVVIWSAPLAIIIALGAITWISTHKLDPYRPLDRIDANRPVTPDIKPITVEVVALDWKWLFFYPEYGIATVNELAAPVDVPINFKLTGSSVMNAFYVPALAGMIYTMPGMQTKLHAVINEPGTYDGLSANYSGEGFTDMRFKFLGLAQDDFDQWVARVKQGGSALNRDTYLKLEKPSIKEPVRYYSSVQEGLYRAVLNMCALEGQMCMDEMMHIDKMGGAGVDSQENRARLQYDNRRATESVEETGDSSDAAAPSTSTPSRGSDAAEVIDINATPLPSSMNQSMQGMQHPTTTGSDESLQAIGQLENDASAKP